MQALELSICQFHQSHHHRSSRYLCFWQAGTEWAIISRHRKQHSITLSCTNGFICPVTERMGIWLVSRSSWCGSEKRTPTQPGLPWRLLWIWSGRRLVYETMRGAALGGALGAWSSQLGKPLGGFLWLPLQQLHPLGRWQDLIEGHAQTHS